MKNEIKIFGFLIALIMLLSVFSCCVGQKTVPIGKVDMSSQSSGSTSQTSDTTSQTQDTGSQSGTPIILAGMSYDTETVDKNNHIQLSIKNYGTGKASNVRILISNDYYSNFTLVSTDPVVKVEGNTFYIGDMDSGEKFDLNIYLKAKQSGVYSGTISYTHDQLETSGKIKDLTTRVP